MSPAQLSPSALSLGTRCIVCQQWAIERRLELFGVERIMRALGISLMSLSLVWFCFFTVGTLVFVPAWQRSQVLFTQAPFMPLSPAFLVYGFALARARTSLLWPARFASAGMVVFAPIGTALGIASFFMITPERVGKWFDKEHQQIVRSTPQVRLGSDFTWLATAGVLIWPVAIIGMGVCFWLLGVGGHRNS